MQKKKCRKKEIKDWVRKGRKRGVGVEPEEQGKQYFTSEDAQEILVIGMGKAEQG